MSLLGTLPITAGARARLRRKAFDLVRVLGGDRDLAARVAGEVSDELRRVEGLGPDPAAPATLAVALQERASGTGVRFVVRDASGERTLSYLLRPKSPSLEALERARAVLAARSREELIASLEASNEALRHSTQEAERAGAAKAQFLANMSHEIRTPMNAIVGLNRLVLATEPTPRQREYLEKIEASTRHLLGVIDDVLDVSKLEAGKLVLEHGTVVLRRVLDEVTTLIAGTCAEKGLELSVEVAPDVPPSVRGDALRLRQVLLNLATNAVKFTERGRIAITVERMSWVADEVALRFTVRDTGIGLSERERRDLFSSFHQADTTITRRFGGTGLGLAISKSLVELMRGRIGVESAQGRGSTFWFTARFAHDEAAAAAPAPPMPISALDPSSRLLMVEDNRLNQEVASALLAELGLAAVVVEDGQQALDALQRERFDLVLMDVQMPVMDGLTATRRMRADPRLADVPVVAMTAAALPSDRQACLDAGMDDVVTKPIDPADLARALAAHLPAAGASEPATEEAPADPIEVLRAVPGLDVERGLRFARRRPGLYLDLLRGFADDQRDLPEQLRASLSRGDRATAERLVHTARGLASGLGAGRLAAAAEALEGLLRAGGEPAAAAVAAAADDLAGAHGELFQALEGLGLRAPGAPAAPVAADDAGAH